MASAGARRLATQGGPVIDVGPLTGPTVDSPEYSGQRVVDHCVDAYIDHIDTRGSSTNMGAGVDDVRGPIAEGKLTEDGTELVDGRALIRARGTDSEGGDYVVLADPDTYRVVIQRGTIGSTGETYTTTYEYLPRTADNLSQLRPPVPDGFTPDMPPTDHDEHACS